MKQRFYVKPRRLSCGSFASQQIPENSELPKRRQSNLHGFPTALMTTVLWLISTPVHACSDPGCGDWCEELPSAYFIRPLNDSRTNLALILEDSQVLHYKVEDIPFSYHAFADIPANTQENDIPPEFTELALSLGVSQATAVSQAEPEGRCISNNYQAILPFWRLLHAAKDISASDKQLLAQERLRLLSFCEKAADSLPVLAVSSEAAKPYADYLHAAAYFYAGKFDALTKDIEPTPEPKSWFQQVIRSIQDWWTTLFGNPPPIVNAPPVVSFKVLSTSSQAWVKETAIYMLGRVYLNQAQKNFQLYSENSKPDSQLLAQARDQFKTYLAAYPQGLYAQSARGLFRKIYWLDNNYADLTLTYNNQLLSFQQQAPAAEELLRFVDELETKYALNHLDEAAAWNSPILATVGAFVAMRPDPNHISTAKPVESYLAVALQAHKDGYTQAGLAALHDYLALAYRFYSERDFATVIQLTNQPMTETALSNTEFSTQVLRGLSLGALGQWDKTEKLWLELFPRSPKSGQQIQLQWLLAMTWRQEDQLNNIYAANSPTKNQKIHDFFIEFASPALLETILVNQQLNPATRTLAYRTLLTNLLTHRQYAEFLRIAKRYPDTQFEGSQYYVGSQFKYYSENTCPNLLALMGGLLKNPTSPTLLNCYGDLIAQLGSPSSAYPSGEDTALSSYTLKSYYPDGQTGLKKGGDGFKGKAYSGMDLYREVIDQQGNKGDAKAYALHSALTCFATTGYNHCGIEDIPIKQRAAWFRLLKTVYKDTIWAKQQKYYW
ncbi:MAG: hypothetical protein LUO95_02495 [Methylococcaceae bacterium]|nr:hypothetical protein [Methylococcaceae bacterium]